MRRIKNVWTISGIKIGILLGGAYLFHEFLEGNMTTEFHKVLYEQLRPNYRMYKYSGDMKRFNPKVTFETLPDQPDTQ